MTNFKDIINKHASRKFEFYNYESITTPKFVKDLRINLGMTQNYFASVLGVSKKTIEKWEQGKNKITGATSLLLYIISKEPETIFKFAFMDTNYTIPERLSNQSINEEYTTESLSPELNGTECYTFA